MLKEAGVKKGKKAIHLEFVDKKNYIEGVKVEMHL